MKNKVLLFILAVALFIPSFVAITSYVRAQNSPVNEKTTTRMVIADLDGNEYVFDKSNNDEISSEMIDFFISMNERATETTGLPNALIGQPFFMVILSTATKESPYQYYFSTNPQDAYFTAPDGVTYKINDEDASRFITSKYAESMYASAEFPSMLLSEQYNVKPSQAQWNYKNYSSSYVAADIAAMINTEVKEYRIDGGFDIKFSLDPDYILLKIVNTADGAVLYDDTYDNIKTLSFDQSAIILVEITADWYEDETRTYYGQAHYSFKTTVSAPAEFYLAKSEIDPGEFVVISAKNVSDPSKIIFNSEPSIEFEPKFYAEGDYVHALVPIKMELANSSYIFSLTYGGVTQEMTLNIKPKNFITQSYQATTSIINNYYTDATIAAYNNEFKQITSTTASERLWKGSFANIIDIKKATIKLGFGHTRSIAGTSLSFRMSGVDYVCTGALDVFATNDGVVVYKDILDFSGYTVVIDHGWGLKSWYTHLSSSSVVVGDTVTRGSVIGVTGSTGFTATTGVNFGLTVFNIPVCPYKLFEDGEDKGVAVYVFGN